MSNRQALITGGAGHVGQAIGKRLAEKEINLILIDKDIDGAKAYAKEIINSYSVSVEILDVDLISDKAGVQAFEQINALTGRLDYLVNNAAFYDDTPGWGVSFEQEGYDAWLKVMRVNLLAPFFLAQQLTPLLEKSEYAAIVNVSSIYGVVGPDFGIYEGLNMTNPAAYAASKGGLVQLTKWLSTAMAPRIRVNTVTPGGIERGQKEEFIKRYNAKTPLGRMANNDDIGNAVAYLLSDEASYITGQNLIVDGGWTVW